MSKMGSKFIRQAESHSLDNAGEVGRLEAEAATRDAAIVGLVGSVDDLRAEVARLGAIVARARAALAPVGMIAMVDVGSYLQLQGRGAMARAIDEASNAICIARAALDGDGA